MEMPNERKWFVYLGDHHEGPFSQEEVRAKIVAGAVTSDHYVWCEGMADWKPMKEVSEFANVGASESAAGGALTAALTEASPIDTSAIEFVDPATQEPLAELGSAAPSPTPISMSSEEILKLADQAPVESIHEEAHPAEGASFETDHPSILDIQKPAKKKVASSAFKRVLLGLLFFAIVGGGGFIVLSGSLTPSNSAAKLNEWLQPFFASFVDQYPQLAKWISPIPRVEGLSDPDNEELQLAARAQLTEQGPHAAIVLSPENAANPSFYVSTNLPGEPEFDLWIRGVRGKIVGQPEAEFRAQVKVQRRLGKSEAIKSPAGPLPKGEYTLLLMEAANQPPTVKDAFAKSAVQPTRGVIPEGLPKDRKMLIRKITFLGGKRDSAYQAELKEYHDRLNLTAQAELKELRELHSFLASELASSEKQNLKYVKTWQAKPTIKAWADFDHKWKEASSARFSEKMATWTAEAIQGFFYGKLFEMLLASNAMVNQAHEMAAKSYAAKADPRLTQSDLLASYAQARTALETLDRKIGEMEKLGPGPDGLPRKDGL